MKRIDLNTFWAHFGLKKQTNKQTKQNKTKKHTSKIAGFVYFLI